MNKFWNIGKANTEIEKASVEADKILTLAKITSLKADGKDVPASDAPLAVKIAAVAALISTGDKTQDVSELIASNGQIAAQVEELSEKLVTTTASRDALSREKIALEGREATANAAIDTLTASNAERQHLLEASNKEASRLAKEISSFNSQLSQRCLACDCLTLVTEDGKPLPKTATTEELQAAADRMPWADKLKAYNGAVNAAMAKTGVSLFAIPTVPASGQAKAPELKGRDRMKAAMKIEGHDRN